MDEKNKKSKSKKSASDSIAPTLDISIPLADDSSIPAKLSQRRLDKENEARARQAISMLKIDSATGVQNDIINHVEALYRRGLLEETYPEPFSRLRIYRPYPRDVDVILEVDDDKTVAVLPEHDLDHIMSRWYRRLFAERYLGEAMSLSMQSSTTRALMRYVRRLHKGDIKIFSFRSESIYSWHKLKFNLLDNRTLDLPEYWAQSLGHESTLKVPRVPWERFLGLFGLHASSWHAMLVRMENAEAFAAWMGSLMDRDCDNHQFLYMQGEGGDGKGTIIRALQAIFSDQLMFTQNIPSTNDGKRFFSENLEGKRILACPEMPEGELFSSYVKSLSGGDIIAVEPKGKKTRQAENHLRVIMASNFWPKIPDNEAARRRIIFIPMQSIGGSNIELGYEQKLIDDAQLFFSIAHFVFKNMPKAGQIEQDRSVYKKNFDEIEGETVEYLANYFHFYPDYQSVEVRHEREYPHMTQSEFSLYVSYHIKEMTTSRIRAVLSEAMDISSVKPIRLANNKLVKCVMGIQPKKDNKGYIPADRDRDANFDKKTP